jgi:hypothetical protein
MLNPRRVGIGVMLIGLLGAGSLTAPVEAQESSAGAAVAVDAPHHALVSRYCLSCHNDRTRTGGFALETINTQALGDNWEAWEKVARKLRARQMPPAGGRRPDEAVYQAALASLEAGLDGLAAAHPDPGRSDTFRRLNRTEYHNAVRDLLALEVDVADLLPSDSSSYGFDNITVGDLSPTLLERYVSAAEKIAQLAVGRAGRAPGGTTVRIRPDLTQEKHIPGLPVGTRGGVLVEHTFPVDGHYDVSVRLARDRNEHVEGLTDSHQVELLLDGERVELFTVERPAYREDVALIYQPSHDNVDAHLKVRMPVTAGPHALGVTFPKLPSLLKETARQPYEAHFNYYRHPRLQPAVYEVSITGPYDATGPGRTRSREQVFVCRPATADEDDACATRILQNLMRRAYRRPVTESDLQGPFELYRAARAADGFEAGVEMALAAVLVSPEFLFRIEQDPNGVETGEAYRLDDLELASRLSFFLWSSIPDDELLDLAERRMLRDPAVLEQQVRRMLADPRSRNLVTNFAGQWLHLRNLDAIRPDMRVFPDFDDNLRQAFRQETEMLVDSVMRENRSVLDLLRADYTFVNERLAKHYGIPHVYGSRFRRVEFDGDEDHAPRGGLLRHGSILLVTSYATRTSPVIRGKWILDNVLGVPPPPPPANVPELEETGTGARALSMRERLAGHRANPACASCHRLMDPVGFAFENYDAVGRWRDADAGAPIDASGMLFDGSAFDGVGDLQDALLARPELFVTTVAEKLLTFATGRGVEYFDGPAIRRIVREAEADDFRFSSLVLEIVNSAPFQMRKAS